MSDERAGNGVSRLTTAIGSIADVAAGIEEQFGRSPDLQIELDALCRKHGVTEEGRRIIETIRKSDPERNVSSGAGNFSGRFPSVKSRFVQQWESKGGERKRLLEFEYDPNVLEYYSQPMAPKYEYISKTGRKVSGRPTIDFFVISELFLGWEEFKPESKLIELAEQNPVRYMRREDGVWDEPPRPASWCVPASKADGGDLSLQPDNAFQPSPIAVVRIYRPGPSVLDGSYTLPKVVQR